MSEKENYALKKYAEVESLPAINNRSVWYGVYRGVRFEINRFTYSETDTEYKWTHYIILNIDEQLRHEMAEKFWLEPEYRKMSEESRERLHYDYYKSPVGDIEFHGGCTFYSKETKIDDKIRVVKIGCDYQHLWDEGKHYDLNYVYTEVKQSIDSLWKIAGPIKIRSWGDGKYRLLEEFQENIT